MKLGDFLAHGDKYNEYLIIDIDTKKEVQWSANGSDFGGVFEQGSNDYYNYDIVSYDWTFIAYDVVVIRVAVKRAEQTINTYNHFPKIEKENK